MTMSAQHFDVVVVGGGPAGQSAALVLGRMRRRVLVLDTESPANAVSNAMHGFLSRDGAPPAEVRRVAREQLRAYETVEYRRLAARAARRRPAGGFEVDLEDGTEVAARRLLLAHGMRYGLPGLEGVAEAWGRHVFHCPYCHGWEVRDRAIAVYGGGHRAVHQALLLRSLSDDVVLLTDGGPDLPAEQRQHLAAAGVERVDGRVERIAEDGGRLRIVLTGRAPLARHALFIQPELALASDLAASLGAALTEVGSVETDAAGQTSARDLYAAGRRRLDSAVGGGGGRKRGTRGLCDQRRVGDGGHRAVHRPGERPRSLGRPARHLVRLIARRWEFSPGEMA
jgi:thioredoxin reductase